MRQKKFKDGDISFCFNPGWHSKNILGKIYPSEGLFYPLDETKRSLSTTRDFIKWFLPAISPTKDDREFKEGDYVIKGLLTEEYKFAKELLHTIDPESKMAHYINDHRMFKIETIKTYKIDDIKIYRMKFININYSHILFPWNIIKVSELKDKSYSFNNFSILEDYIVESMFR